MDTPKNIEDAICRIAVNQKKINDLTYSVSKDIMVIHNYLDERD